MNSLFEPRGTLPRFPKGVVRCDEDDAPRALAIEDCGHFCRPQPSERQR